MPRCVSPGLFVYSTGQLTPRHHPTRRPQPAYALPFVCLALLLASPQSNAGSSNLHVSSLQVEVGETISIMLSIDAAPNEAGAFGIELNYDTQTLRYTDTFIRGELTQEFTLFDVNEATPGMLIIAGVTTDAPIATGANGVLVLLDFDVLECPPQASPLTVQNLVDDIETWTTMNGSVECGAPILLISEDVLRIPATSGSSTLSISNGGDGELTWEVEVVTGSEWLSVNPQSGTGDATVTATYSPNTASATRGARIEFRSTTPPLDSTRVDVIQAAAVNPGGDENPPTQGCAANNSGTNGTAADWWLLAAVILLCPIAHKRQSRP